MNRPNNPNAITYFAEADFRNKRVPFGIKSEDRARHMYVIGKTGMGKSTMLENMAIQDIQNGEGIAFIDPHGSSAELLLDYVPPERVNDVVYFAPFDTDFPVSFNIMEDVGRDKRHLVANGLMSAFKRIWADAWSARMEYILSNTLLALLEYPNATLLGVNRMLVDGGYRKKVVDNITDSSVRSFWVDEFAKYTDKYTKEATPAIQNKIGQFVSNPIIRNIIGQPKSSFDLRKMMDEKKILIMNLSKGKMGEQNANLIGSMLVTKIYLAAMSRADASASEMRTLPPFYFFVDEFQSFANESFADILSEARKYKLALTIAHQYIEQMPEEVRDAVFGNVGTMITFRVGSYDAEVLEREFLPVFTQEDIVNLGKQQIYLRLMIDGVSSRPFSAVTMAPIERPEISEKERILEHSHAFFAQPREKVEQAVLDWYASGNAPAHAPAQPKSPQTNSAQPNQSQPTHQPINQSPSPQKSPVAPPAHSPFPKTNSFSGEKKTFIPKPVFRPDQASQAPQTSQVPQIPQTQNNPIKNAPANTSAGYSYQKNLKNQEAKPVPPVATAPAVAVGAGGTPIAREINEKNTEENLPEKIQEKTQEEIQEKIQEKAPEKVLEKIEEKKERKEVISLSDLRPKSSPPPPPPRNPKIASPENKNALKNALLAALGGGSEKSGGEEKNPSAESEKTLPVSSPTPIPVPTPAPAGKTESHANTPKEIPEDVLRGMLSL